LELHFRITETGQLTVMNVRHHRRRSCLHGIELLHIPNLCYSQK